MKKQFFLLFVILFTIQTQSNATLEQSSLLSFIDTPTQGQINKSSMYLKANYLQYSGQPHKAMTTYKELFSQDTSPQAYRGYLHLLSDTNQFDTIVGLIDKTQDFFKNDLDIQLIYAQSLLNTNRDKQAETLLEKLKAKHPENEQIVYYSAAHHEKTNNLKKALEEIDSFLKNRPQRSKLFLFYFLKSKIHLKMKDHNLALIAITQSLQLYPKFDKGILFKALLFEQMGNINQAISAYKEFLAIAGEDSAIRKQIVQLLFSQKRFGEAAQALRKINGNEPEYYFDLALLEWKAKQSHLAIKHIDEALQKDPAFSKAKMLKIEILLSKKQYKQVLTIIEQWLIQTPNDNNIIHTLLILQNKEVDTKNTLNVLENVHNKHKKHTNIILAMGDLYLQLKQYEQALTTYKKILSLSKNENLKAKIRFQIGFIYFTMNNTKETITILQKAVKEQIVYPSTYNLLAYCYASTNQHLDKAIMLIDKALDYDVQSSHFLDTKGFILYKQQKYPQAVETFKLALQFAPQNKIIEKHLNDAKAKQPPQKTIR